MTDFIYSGLAALVVFALMVVEGVLLTAYFCLTGRGIPPAALLCSLSAGAGLVMALFASLIHADWPWIAAALTVSLAGHVADVTLRWRQKR